MPNTARNHEESRKAVCLLCLKKTTSELTATVIDRIKLFVCSNLNFEDSRVPAGICSTCRKALQEKQSDSESKRKLPDLFDFSKIKIPVTLRSSSVPCTCTICQIARSVEENGIGNGHPLAISSRKRGRPETLDSDQQVSFKNSPPPPEKKCPRCLSIIGKGKRHICTPKTLTENLSSLAETFPKSGEHLASSIIKQKEASPGGTVRLSQLFGKPYPVVPGSSKSFKTQATPCLTTSSMIEIQQATGLSNTKMRNLASVIHKSTPKKSGIEPYFQKKFADAGRALEDHFYTQNVMLESKGEEVERQIVTCTDLNDFVQELLDVREVSPHDSLSKLSLDNGGGFFKVSLSIIDKNEEKNHPGNQKKPKQNLKKPSSLSSGVKKIFIISIAENISETHKNIQKILKPLCLEKIKFIVACDLKIANLLCGIQSHASKHPCCYCDVSSDFLQECGELQTFGSLRTLSKMFNESKAKDAKQFYNCTKDPLLPEEDSARVLDVIPPPELHLLIGVVNHLFSGMKKLWPQASEWPQFFHILPEVYHGGQSFNGPACHKLLQNVDKLEQLAQDKSQFQVQMWISAFRDFQAVVHGMFGMHLCDNYLELILKFKASCEVLPISITPKIHIVFHHVAQFIQKSFQSLGHSTEQAAESLHRDFSLHWNERFKRNQVHPDYKNNLLKAVVEYNSKHI